ncbi:MAG: CvpA family protein [Agathobacter sp.]|uniref:CvpA family protein n=1 Tax=Agathobacter sp. TaxID=2021311 RepID=UPI00258CA02C|nr:CvpA family protein [Agathobacter sp.]MCR5678109.1 CvpA family protein [Agathobacter sp.]
MNWVLVVFALILAWQIAWGYTTGFLRVVYSLAKWVLIIAILVWLTPMVANILSTQTALQTTIETRVEKHFEEKAKEVLTDEKKDANQTGVLTPEELGVYLPMTLLEKVPNLGTLAEEQLQQNGVYHELATKISSLAIYGIAAILVLIIAFLACHIMVTLFRILENLPGISFVNHGLGLAAGAIKGMVIIWVLLALLALEAGTAAGRFIGPYIYESPVLNWLYENNFVLSIWMIFF